jgi:putative methionine-R-sulfoxide reductase with GAF domain
MSERVPRKTLSSTGVTVQIVTLATPVIVGWLIAFRKDPPGWETWFVGWSIGLIALWICLQIAVKRDAKKNERANADDVAELRVAMKDGLLPLIRLISRMPDMSMVERSGHLKTASESAVWALARLLMAHVDRARANIYLMEPDESALRLLAYGGRGEAPGEFIRGGDASDAALARVKAGEPLIVGDWREDPPPGFSKPASEWSSFVSVPIVGGDRYAYGMISVDSPTAHSFVDTDRHIVTVVAELLAIAFALAYPKDDRGSNENVGGGSTLDT